VQVVLYKKLGRVSVNLVQVSCTELSRALFQDRNSPAHWTVQRDWLISCEGVSSSIKRLRCSVFTRCPIGAIGSTYKSRKISKIRPTTYHEIFRVFSWTRLWVNLTKIGKLLRRDFGGGVGKKKVYPQFSPHWGGQGAPKFLCLRGLVGIYLSSKLEVPPLKNGVRGWLLPVSKNFH